ncbi:putative PLP-dependent aminotransferase [Aquirufa aurantiipilula]
MDKKSEVKFIWPESNFEINTVFKYSNPNEVEAEFRKIYPNVFPVLFSSARAGIVNLLIHLNANKLTKVWTPYYASHCVLEAISRVGFPTPDDQNSNIALVYHQWGYTQKFENDNHIIIEDSADSFFLPGQVLFPNNSSYQIVSLPKSLGCSGGGILFCKSEEEANSIRLIRNTKSNYNTQHFILKLLGQYNKHLYNYWDSLESTMGFPSSLLCTDILMKLNKIHVFSERVKSNFIRLEQAGLTLNVGKLSEDRLPCVIPLVNFDFYKNKINSLIKELRMFNTSRNYQNCTFEKVLPIPIHIDIDESFLDKFLSHG